MAATLVSTSNAVWGFASSESGLFVESMTQTVSDPHEFILNQYGQRAGFAHNVNSEQQIQVSGELNGTIGATGLLAHTFGTSCTLANTISSLFGITTGVVYLTSGTIGLQRSGWKTVNMSYARYPLIV